MVAAEEGDRRRVADLEGEQQADHLERVAAAIDVVAKKDVRDVLLRSAAQPTKSSQVKPSQVKRAAPWGP